MQDILILDDQMDAIALIKKDHREVERLFETYKSSTNVDEKYQIVQAICLELVNI
jgi:hypothetical protein